jgi:hypothetical protein
MAKKYKLLSINDTASWQTKHLFARPGNSDSYTINSEDGHAPIRAEMSNLVREGVRFENCIFTTHGYPGGIWFGETWIDAEVWYKQFYDRGYGPLFLKNAKLYFAGCNVADGADGWKFLEAAARSLLRVNGGTAMAWTSSGFAGPWSGHMRHFWGDTRQVMVLAGGTELRFFENWKLITDGGGVPVRPG